MADKNKADFTTMDLQRRRDLFKACKDGNFEALSRMLTPENVHVLWGLEEDEALEKGIERSEIYTEGSVRHVYDRTTTLLHVAAAGKSLWW